jgi:hypothetical protein
VAEQAIGAEPQSPSSLNPRCHPDWEHCSVERDVCWKFGVCTANPTISIVTAADRILGQ